MTEINQKKIFLAITIIFFLLANILFIKSIQSNDTWFHLKIGQEILENKQIPTADFHSFTAYGSKYINQNWLAQVILFLVYKISSFLGLQLLHSLLVLGTLLLIFFLGKSKEKQLNLLILLFIIPLAMAHDEIRPLIFTWFFSALTVFLIDKQKLYLIPFIFLFWVNIHAGFLLGLGALFFYSIIEYKNTRKTHLPIIFALSFLATLINPSFIKIYFYPFTINESVKAMQISEWQPFGINTLYFWLYLTFVITLITLSIKKKVYKTNFIEFIFILSFSIFGFTSMRQPIVVCILLSPLFLKYLSEIVKTKYKKFIYIFTLLVLISLFPFYKVSERIHRGLTIDKITFPVYGLDFIKKNQISGFTFNDYDFGGFLILFQPEKLIFGDGRLEIYQGQPIKNYITAARGHTGWDKVLEKYKIDCIFIRPTLELNKEIILDPSWELVYYDDSSVIYLKKGSYLNVPRLTSITPYFNRSQDVNLNINEYQYLLKENPNYANGYKVLAFLYLEKNDIAAAKYHLQQYITRHPQNKNDSGISQIKAFLKIK